LSANASSINGLSGKFTVKIDANGYVAGFGLAVDANSAAPTSSFIIRADSFSIANPSGPGITPAMPFIVRTTATTINGVSVPAGVYIRDAFIENGAISNAKIGNLAVDSAKIANGSIVNAKIADAAISTAKIQNAAITNALIADAAITNAKIADAAITNAKIGTAAVDTLKIAGNAVTQPIIFTAPDVFASNTISEGAGTFTFVGFGNGDYTYDYQFGYFYLVGPGNGDYTLSNSSTISGGHLAIQTGMVNVGDGSSGGLIVVLYATMDGSAARDAGQYLIFQIDRHDGNGFQTVLRTLVGARTSGGDTFSVMPVALPYSVTGVQNVSFRAYTGNRHISNGGATNASFLRNIVISVLGAKR
jgi:hypothetical protein